MTRIGNTYKNKYAALFALMSGPMATFAQEAAAPAQQAGVDPIWWLIITVMIILLAAVLLLGNVMIKLATILAEKSSLKSVALIGMLMLSGVMMAQDPANAVHNPPLPEVKTSNVFGDWNLVMAVVVLLAELLAVVFLLLRIRQMLNDLAPAKEEKKAFSLQVPNLLDKFNASVAVEKESDVLLDHNYDGIKELDNNLPPWWKYGFYFTIVWAVIYMFYYHVSGGPSSIDEYNTAMEEARIQQEAYARANANKVDENNVTLADAMGIADGRSVYDANCAACHGKIGEGGVGPNLTDAYWIHGGSLSEVFKSIKYGWPAKGMKAWQTDLSAVQMKNVTSFIHSLQGSNPPNAKAPEGDLYTEKTEEVAAAQ